MASNYTLKLHEAARRAADLALSMQVSERFARMADDRKVRESHRKQVDYYRHMLHGALIMIEAIYGTNDEETAQALYEQLEGWQSDLAREFVRESLGLD